MPTIDTIAKLVRIHGKERPDRPALTAGDRTMTFAELDQRSSQVANALQAEGVGPQDRVAFLDKNSIEYFELLFGGAKLNAVNVAVNWRLAPPEIAYIVNDAEAKVFVVGQEFVPALDAIESELTTVKKIVVIGGHPTHQDYEDWMGGQPAADPGVDGAREDVAFQLYTSGTTGLPKGVMLTNANLFSLLGEVLEDWYFDEDSVNLVAMPLFHIGGSGYATVGMFAGCHTILMRDVDPSAMLNMIPEKGITNMFAVPAVLQFMLMMPNVKELDYSTLRCVVYGASPISVEVLAGSIETFKCAFIQAYGLTETTGVIVALMPEDHDPSGPNAHRLRSAGKPISGVELRIVSAETGTDAAQGEVGEIWARTSQNMLGYWKKPEETAKTITDDGWLKTGDAGYLDEDGYLYIHDRVKDMIVSGGENIYPAEVENCLMSHPDIADVAVIGVPSDKWGETVKALVVRREGSDPDEKEIMAFAKERIASYKCPTSVDWIDALPRNPSGKILKRELRAPYWEGRERNVG
ncbi:MAG TPA: fatty acid--CoA ligase [Acidimicrobiales bacterium]|nr:fatty acid--CoA ligase [Acidimicrobiales bacterium]